MSRDELLQSIIKDLGANYSTDDESILSEILDEVIDDALFASNRYSKAQRSPQEKEKHITVLQSDIRNCTKSIYLRRGAEEISSENNGVLSLNMTFENAIDNMTAHIIKTGKRLLR